MNIEYLHRKTSSIPLSGVGKAAVSKNGVSRFINRELSWLAFNGRVLEEAANERHPLLERIRFLGISASNLDEFYMVRVAGLKAQVRAGISHPSPDGKTPIEQLAAIESSSAELRSEQTKVWEQLRSQLRHAELEIVDVEELDGYDFSWLEKYFDSNIFPV